MSACKHTPNQARGVDVGQSLAALSQATMRIIMDDKELRETAYHEAGHYVAKWALVGEAVYGDNLSIVPDNEKGTLGHCQPLEENIDSEESCRAYIISLYAGAVGCTGRCVSIGNSLLGQLFNLHRVALEQ